MRYWRGTLALGAVLAIAMAITPVAAAAAGTITYQYDPLGRLLSASYPNGYCITYSYDAAGNRAQAASASSGTPSANPISITATENLATTFDPRVSNPSCASLTVNSVGTPSHGTASIVGGGVGVTYTPANNYTGSDSFTYTLTDGQHTSPAGTISVSVKAGTLGPTALNGGGTFFQEIIPPACVTPAVTTNVTSLISDPYGYTLTVTQVTNGARGTVAINGTNLTYTYNTRVCGNLDDADAYTYTVSDPQGRTATATITVTIAVTTNQ